MEDRTLVIERMVAQVSAAFGVLALVVACVRLYGVLAYPRCYDILSESFDPGVHLPCRALILLLDGPSRSQFLLSAELGRQGRSYHYSHWARR